VLNRRVLVVGTTADYIEIIFQRFPGRALFLTDACERAKAAEPPPDASAEVLADLSRPEDCIAALGKHLDRWRIGVTGVACFDCESLALAAQVADRLGLPFPSAAAVAASRSKFHSKRLWLRAGLPCPAVRLVRRPSDAVRLMERVGGPIVLKPLTGSGSEFVFLCSTADDCRRALRALRVGVREHPNRRMYGPGPSSVPGIDTRSVFAAEQFVRGEEYSCDFILDGAGVEVIRIARKIYAPGHAIGTVMAYVVPADLPPAIDPAGFRRQLGDAARALGLRRAMCMLDFIVADGKAVMIELTPRPGGDCLPFLISRCSGFDMFGCALDFAEGRAVVIPGPGQWRLLVGLRLFALRPGVIRAMDSRGLCADPRVLECSLKRGPGERIVLPPQDYDSRLLGHVIFEPSPAADIAQQCIELTAKLALEMHADDPGG